MHTQNLIKLANYLATLPENYDKFNMIGFVGVNSRIFEGDVEDLKLEYPTAAASIMTEHCGTVACALGHGTLIPGLESNDQDESWWGYAERVFDVNPNRMLSKDTLMDHVAFTYMFDSGWFDFDNTARGAAERIAVCALHPESVTNVVLAIHSTTPDRHKPFDYSNVDKKFIRTLAYSKSLEALCDSITFPVEI